jgi:hypothetical protein
VLLGSLDLNLNELQTDALAVMRATLAPDLAKAAPFEEVVGDRRMLRFLRGHKFVLQTAVKMMRAMLQWRLQNDIDAIREKIVRHPCIWAAFVTQLYRSSILHCRTSPMHPRVTLCPLPAPAPCLAGERGLDPGQVPLRQTGALSCYHQLECLPACMRIPQHHSHAHPATVAVAVLNPTHPLHPPCHSCRC